MLSGPVTASIANLLGCQLEIRAIMACNADNEYWTIDDILVQGVINNDNACFTSASMSVSETGIGASSDYTYTQTIPLDGSRSLEITAGNLIRVVLPDGDFSTATLAGSSVDGSPIAGFTTQTTDTLEFVSPVSLAEGSSFDIVISGSTNPGAEDEYNSSIEAINDEGGINHYNYSYVVGPDLIWYEDFESYADNATTAVDNNSNDVGIDWTIEPGAGNSFRVRNFYQIDRNRGLLARRTDAELAWTTEVIDISAYDNVSLSLDYGEFGTLEPSETIDIEYRIDGASWVDFQNNGFHIDDLPSGPETATSTGLLGCTVEIRAKMFNDADNEYWTVDNVRVSSESSPTNSCFENTNLTLSNDGVSVVNDYTYTQSIRVDGAISLDIGAGNTIQITINDGDFSTATIAGSSFNGTPIASFLVQNSDTIIFNAPTSITEGVSFDIVIANVTNPPAEGLSSSQITAINDAGGINHFNYQVNISPLNNYARLDGDWNDGSTWSRIGVGGNTCDCIPGSSSNVTIDGFDISVDGIMGSASTILVQNDTLNNDASLTILNGSLLNISGDMDLELDDAGENTSLNISNNSTQLNIGGDLNLNAIAGTDLLVSLNDSSELNITGDLNIVQSGGDDIIVSLNNNSGTNSLLNVAGRVDINKVAGDELQLNLDEESRFLVTGDFQSTISGGDDILFNFGNNSIQSTALLSIDGSMTIDHNGNTGGDDFLINLFDSTRIVIDSELILDTDFNSGSILSLTFNDNSELEVNSDLDLIAIADDETNITFNNSSRFKLGGTITRSGGLGNIDFNNNSILELDGIGGAQIITENTGTGNDAINYNNLILNNSFGTAPQFTLDGNVNIPGTIEMINGILNTSGNLLINSNSTSTSIYGYSQNCFIIGTLRKSIVTNTDTFPLPVGTGNNPTDYQFAEFINNNVTGITALDVSVNTITEAGNNVDSNLDPAKASAGPNIVNIFEDAEWDITPIGALSGGDFGINLYVANISGLSDAADNTFTVLKRPSSSTDYFDWDAFDLSTNMPDIDSTGRIYNGGTGFAQRTGFTSFSKFAIGASAGAALPIELSDFQVFLENDIVAITWVTQSETNNSHFTIEKSSDPRFGWTELKKVKGKDNSTMERKYLEYDHYPYSGFTFYRLKQTDNDGISKYSAIRSVFLETNLNISVYPIPFLQELHFEGLPENSKYQIFNSIGSLIIESNSSLVNTSKWPHGVYEIRFLDKNGVFYRKKVVK